MNNKIKAILMAVAVSSMVLTQGVSAAQFDDGNTSFFIEGNSVAEHFIIIIRKLFCIHSVIYLSNSFLAI